ncbi:MAG: hypothetical protein DRJ50_13900, partial [Actinobacteria bacterium]
SGAPLVAQAHEYRRARLTEGAPARQSRRRESGTSTDQDGEHEQVDADQQTAAKVSRLDQAPRLAPVTTTTTTDSRNRSVPSHPPPGLFWRHPSGCVPSSGRLVGKPSASPWPDGPPPGISRVFLDVDVEQIARLGPFVANDLGSFAVPSATQLQAAQHSSDGRGAHAKSAGNLPGAEALVAKRIRPTTSP